MQVNFNILKYLEPKMNVNLDIKSLSMVQRTYQIGTTPEPSTERIFNPSSGTYDTVPSVVDRKIVATTSTVFKIY
jgi:hypothetical protein